MKYSSIIFLRDKSVLASDFSDYLELKISLKTQFQIELLEFVQRSTKSA